jgi:hypothetical protein
MLLETISAFPIEVTAGPRGDLLYNDAAISATKRDIQATNGVIQGLDGVFEPPTVDQPDASAPDTTEPVDDEPVATDPNAADG